MTQPVARDRPEILYVCVHNAGRSQMAALLTTTSPPTGSSCGRPAPIPPTT